MSQYQNLHNFSNASENKATKHFIIGMGASAGGLEALQQFFKAMLNTEGLSFVVVQHLSPDYKSLLAEILGKCTHMTVIQAENEMEVLPEHVYLIPPKNNMILREDRLYLTEYVHSGANHSIDTFFSSLAEARKERSVAVVFSGTGSDGTNGIKSIKEYGGLAIVQEPSSAKFDGMPKNAINTGLVDFVLTPSGIAEEIFRFSGASVIVQADQQSDLSTEELLTCIYAILRKVCRIDFTFYKRSTLMRRIERRMVVSHRERPSDYLQLLETSEEESRLLGKEILIGVTNFFRDSAYFETLKTKVIYNILSNSTGDEPIRIWVAGCSTGEEAYSIAILFSEVMEEQKLQREIKIFATDIDPKAIETAGKGGYSESILDDISSERIAKYFLKKNDQYIIGKEIRRMIIFAPHNMFQDPPFGRLDLISCRNVLIYFQPALQKNVFAVFHSSLKNGGYLFLGKSETAGDFADVFQSVCHTEKIYLHTSGGRLPEPAAFQISPPEKNPQQGYAMEFGMEEKKEWTLTEIYCRFLEKYLPPTVVLDEKNEVVHFFGEYSEFFHIGLGKATFNIFSLLDDDLSLVLSTALNKCRNEKSDVTYTDVAIKGTMGYYIMDLIIQPVCDKRGKDTGLISIVFSTHASIEPSGQIERYDINKTAAQRIFDLERELLATQGNLKNTVGELEMVNEELQAANEELLTANEELQSSNEELQSVNEELYTVNSEYQHKVDELIQMTNDLSNFLSSTMIGILFVDNTLNIRKFTDYIGREFKLMEQDVGRPLQIISHFFADEDIVKDACGVLKTLTPLDREITASNGRHYTERIAPYRTTENSIKGLVITIIDSLMR